jgi:hypothetical protein
MFLWLQFTLSQLLFKAYIKLDAELMTYATDEEKEKINNANSLIL